MSKESFSEKLRELINQESIENGSDTPDYILSRYLMRCLEAFEETMTERDAWYGVERVQQSVARCKVITPALSQPHTEERS